MNNLINALKKKKPLSQILACLIIVSSTAGINFSAANGNELNDISTSQSSTYKKEKQNNSISTFFSNQLKKIKNSFDNDEKKLSRVVKKLEKTKIKDEFKKYNNINIKTSSDLINYYEKVLKLILNTTEEYYDDVSISSSKKAYTILKDHLIKTIAALQLSAETTQNNDINQKTKDATSHAENIKTLKDFRDVSCELLDIIILVKNAEKNQDYQKLIYDYNKDFISKVNKCATYSYNIYNKTRVANNYNGEWLFSKKNQHSGYINYEEAENTIFVTFRGTKSCEDVRTDIKFTKKNCDFLNNKGVHSGFLNAYNHFKPELIKKINGILEKHNDAKIVFTGHSLGGAVATLAALDASTNNEFKDKDISLITFCAPRALSEEAYNYSLTNKDIQKLYEQSARIWRTGDVVSSIPFEGYNFNFRHFGKSWCIDKFPDKYEPSKTGILSWFSYSEWRKWFKSFHSFHTMEKIKTDILKIYENNKEYLDKIKIYKN